MMRGLPCPLHRGHCTSRSATLIDASGSRGLTRKSKSTTVPQRGCNLRPEPNIAFGGKRSVEAADRCQRPALRFPLASHPSDVSRWYKLYVSQKDALVVWRTRPGQASARVNRDLSVDGAKILVM